MEEDVVQWIPPTYDTTKIPSLITSKPVIGGTLESDNPNFYRCAKWAGDGSAFLASMENRTFHVATLGDDVNVTDDHIFRQPGPILDFLWYPASRAEDPATFCFVASVRDCPIKLLDASDGRLRASYKIVDHRERFIAPHALSFNPTVTKLYCGFQDAIEIFDVNAPGEGERLLTSPSKKSRAGLKGIISSIAFCTDYSGLFAVSSLSSSIALFSESEGSNPVGYVKGLKGAITQLQYHPTQPHILIAARRKSNELLSWDMRNPSKILQTFPRQGNTNQKLRFDLNWGGQWLVTGDQAGSISFFETSNLGNSSSTEPTLTFSAHKDSVGSVALHPTKPILLSVSGGRHYELSSVNNSSSETSSDTSTSSENENETLPPRIIRRGPVPKDSSLKLWDFSHRVQD